MPPLSDRHLDGGDVRGFYTALGVYLPRWAAVEASVQCFADPEAHRRSDRKASCSVNLASGLWNCHGCGAAGNPFHAALRAGHTEQSAEELLIRFGLTERRRIWPGRRARSPITDPPREPRASALAISEGDIARWRTDLSRQPLIVQRLARERAWSVSTIRAFELGIDGNRITIPVRDARGCLVSLLRYRAWGTSPTAKILAVAGSHRRLLPHPASESSPEIILVEGEPDMLAARSLELPAIAVPGTESWRAEWADLFPGRRVAIIMDADHQGRAAARRIADDLAPQAETTIIDIDPERNDGYDLTDWILDRRADPGGLHLMRLFDQRRSDGL